MSRRPLFRRPDWTPRRLSEPGSFDDELTHHLAARADELVAAGASAAEAKAQAAREFGDADDARRYIAALDAARRRSRKRRRTMTGFGQDLRYAVRRLRRAPAFTIAVVLTFALGIGATAAIFAIVNGVLMKPLPFPSPERLYAVYSANRTADILQGSVSPVDLDDWRARRQVIADLGGYFYMDETMGIALTGRGAPRRLRTLYVTAGFFPALGVTPEAGRLPREDELVRGGQDRVVVLSDGFWAREFGRARDVLGATLTLNSEPYTVLGVLPPGTDLTTTATDLYVPYATIPDSDIPRLRMVRLLSVIARARPGVPADRLAAELSTITAALARQYPDDRAWDGATIEPLTASLVAPVADRLWVLFGAVAFVLAMACVNVTSLQVNRAASQAGNVAIASALGAARARILRQLVTEGLLLSVAGALLGVLVAVGGVSVFLRLTAGQLPRAASVHVDGSVLALVLTAALGAGLLSTLGPALHVTRAGNADALRGRGRSIADVESPRLRAALVVTEVAVALILAVSAGLMGRTFAALVHVDPGFKPDHVLAVAFSIDEQRHGADASPGGGSPATVYYSKVLERVRALPGVVSAGAVNYAPFRGSGERVGFRIPTEPVPPGQDPPTARLLNVSDGYFGTIGAHLLDGRDFTRDDRADTPLVTVVSAAFARRYFPGRRAVGQRLLLGANRSATIVGLVGDIRQTGLADPVRPTLYMDNLQNTRVKTTIVARTQSAPALMTTALRDAVWSVDPAQPIADIFTFDEALSQSLASPRLLLVLLGAFGISGVALGVVGVYGLLASLVTRRRAEIGLRRALGASAVAVTSLVIRRGAGLALVGIAVGLAGTFAVTRFLAAVLYGVTPFDPLTVAVVSMALLLAALLASWFPARRAAAIDPATTLRAS